MNIEQEGDQQIQQNGEMNIQQEHEQYDEQIYNEDGTLMVQNLIGAANDKRPDKMTGSFTAQIYITNDSEEVSEEKNNEIVTDNDERSDNVQSTRIRPDPVISEANPSSSNHRERELSVVVPAEQSYANAEE